MGGKVGSEKPIGDPQTKKKKKKQDWRSFDHQSFPDSVRYKLNKVHNILIVLFLQQVTSFENPSSEKQSTSFLSRFISKRKDKVMSWLLVSTKVIFLICRIDHMKSELVYLASLLGFPVRLVESQKAAAFLNVFSYRQFFELRYNPKVLPKLLSPVFSFS